MKVQLADREVWIEFAYRPGTLSTRYHGLATVTELTVCLLRDGSAPRGPREAAPILAIGKVVRYFKDPPNREQARKEALAQALMDLDLKSSARDAWRSTPEAKARRKLFWDAYLNRKQSAPKVQAVNRSDVSGNAT